MPPRAPPAGTRGTLPGASSGLSLHTVTRRSQHTPGITAGLARDSAPSNPGSGRRGDAVLPFAPLGKVGREHFLALPGAMLGRHPRVRPATHCPARPTPRCGVTAPPSTPLTSGGESTISAYLDWRPGGWSRTTPSSSTLRGRSQSPVLPGRCRAPLQGGPITCSPTEVRGTPVRGYGRAYNRTNLLPRAEAHDADLGRLSGPASGGRGRAGDCQSGRATHQPAA